MSQQRELALNAALEINRGRMGDAKDVIKSAKEIEAYLNGTDAKPAGGATIGGNFGQILPGTNLANHGRAQ